jgi:hypothetical protein
MGAGRLLLHGFVVTCLELVACGGGTFTTEETKVAPMDAAVLATTSVPEADVPETIASTVTDASTSEPTKEAGKVGSSSPHDAEAPREAAVLPEASAEASTPDAGSCDHTECPLCDVSISPDRIKCCMLPDDSGLSMCGCSVASVSNGACL